MKLLVGMTLTATEALINACLDFMTVEYFPVGGGRRVEEKKKNKKN